MDGFTASQSIQSKNRELYEGIVHCLNNSNLIIDVSNNLDESGRVSLGVITEKIKTLQNKKLNNQINDVDVLFLCIQKHIYILNEIHYKIEKILEDVKLSEKHTNIVEDFFKMLAKSENPERLLSDYAGKQLDDLYKVIGGLIEDHLNSINNINNRVGVINAEIIKIEAKITTSDKKIKSLLQTILQNVSLDESIDTQLELLADELKKIDGGVNLTKNKIKLNKDDIIKESVKAINRLSENDVKKLVDGDFEKVIQNMIVRTILNNSDTVRVDPVKFKSDIKKFITSVKVSDIVLDINQKISSAVKNHPDYNELNAEMQSYKMDASRLNSLKNEKHQLLSEKFTLEKMVENCDKAQSMILQQKCSNSNSLKGAVACISEVTSLVFISPKIDANELEKFRKLEKNNFRQEVKKSSRSQTQVDNHVQSVTLK